MGSLGRVDPGFAACLAVLHVEQTGVKSTRMGSDSAFIVRLRSSPI
jgi:hypothetical protein